MLSLLAPLLALAAYAYATPVHIRLTQANASCGRLHLQSWITNNTCSIQTRFFFPSATNTTVAMLCTYSDNACTLFPSCHSIVTGACTPSSEIYDWPSPSTRFVVSSRYSTSGTPCTTLVGSPKLYPVDGTCVGSTTTDAYTYTPIDANTIQICDYFDTGVNGGLCNSTTASVSCQTTTLNQCDSNGFYYAYETVPSLSTGGSPTGMPTPTSMPGPTPTANPNPTSSSGGSSTGHTASTATSGAASVLCVHPSWTMAVWTVVTLTILLN